MPGLHWQMPPTHNFPRLTLHGEVHAPQWRGWTCVSVQNPPQLVSLDSQTSGAAVVVVVVVVGAGVVVVVVVGAGVVVVVATVSEQFPGGMQRELVAVGVDAADAAWLADARVAPADPVAALRLGNLGGCDAAGAEQAGANGCQGSKEAAASLRRGERAGKMIEGTWVHIRLRSVWGRCVSSPRYRPMRVQCPVSGAGSGRGEVRALPGRHTADG